MLTDAAATAVFTQAPYALVLADAVAATVLALDPQPLVLANAAAATVLALAPHSPVLADATTTTVFEVLLCRWCSHRSVRGFLHAESWAAGAAGWPNALIVLSMSFLCHFSCGPRLVPSGVLVLLPAGSWPFVSNVWLDILPSSVSPLWGGSLPSLQASAHGVEERTV